MEPNINNTETGTVNGDAAPVLTLDEINKRFPSEWILLNEPQTAPGPVLLGGRVLWHSRERDEVYRKALELRPRRSTFWHTGKIPKDTYIFL